MKTHRRHEEVVEEFVLLHGLEEFILRVDDDAEDELLSAEEEDEILLVVRMLPSSFGSTRRTNSSASTRATNSTSNSTSTSTRSPRPRRRGGQILSFEGGFALLVDTEEESRRNRRAPPHLLRIDKEDGLPLKAEEFVLHVDADDEHLSAQEELSS